MTHSFPTRRSSDLGLVVRPITGRFSIDSRLDSGAGWLTSSFTVAGVTRAVGARLTRDEELFVLDPDGGDRPGAFDSGRRGGLADDLLALSSGTLQIHVYELVANSPFVDGFTSFLAGNTVGAVAGSGDRQSLL